MKTRFPIRGLVVVLALVLFEIRPVRAGQFNFQLLPPPVPYPSFEPERTDLKISGMKYGVTTHEAGGDAANMDISGLGAYVMARHALNEYVALDGLVGAFGASGKMPGIALPFIYGSGYWNPVIEDRGRLTAFGLPLAFDVEVQLLHKPGGSVILFGGPNLSFGSATLLTQYHAVSGSTRAGSTDFKTDATLVMGGAQFGVQAGLNLGPVTVSPFVMMIPESGSATFTFDDGYRGTDQLQGTTANIDPFVVTATGADILYRPWGLSIGTLLQSVGSTTNQSGYTLKYIQLSWHFRTK